MARSICLLLACSALLCCASLAQAATKAAKSKDVTKLQIGVKARGPQSAIRQWHAFTGLICALWCWCVGVMPPHSELQIQSKGSLA